MKFSIIVVIATLVFAFAAHFLLQDPGYVAINFRGYLVEMSVPVLLGIAIVLVVAVWAIRKLIIAPRMIGEAAGRYRAGRAGQKMMRGMIEVAEGNFARGEKLLARAASTSDAPLFNYLQAARAAHLQGNDQRRDEWLKLAYEHTPAATNAVLLTQAELQLDRDRLARQALLPARRLGQPWTFAAAAQDPGAHHRRFDPQMDGPRTPRAPRPRTGWRRVAGGLEERAEKPA
jgi:HemY protein